MQQFLVLAVMVKLRMIGAHLYPNPRRCRLVGLVMVFGVLHLLIFVCV